MLKAGIWYVAYATLMQTSRPTYQLLQHSKAGCSPARFGIPANSTPASFWQAATERFEAEIYRGTATVCVNLARHENALSRSAWQQRGRGPRHCRRRKKNWSRLNMLS
ncbi:MAG: hypothetical protein IPP88_21955 [Betaproteobacteria bacterium]|nr:hypothetical protein [Betaproteobacteria bacterium]